MHSNTHGVIEHPRNSHKPDFLYRISLNGIIRNSAGEVLLVKERGREWWDLPGGGMDHGESIKEALAREMKEEVGLTGDFTYRIVHVDEPKLLKRAKIFQTRLIFVITPERMNFQPGEDGDEVAFWSLEKIKAVDASLFDYLTVILSD